MSKPDQATCRALLNQERPAAIEVKRIGGVATWWIPRSQIGYLRRDKEADGSTIVTFTLPEWLVEEKQAWDIVTS